ncbi:hypothetical protein KKF84_16710 [Myxococcota bacterium]|nr:hypothetical protein [Myxococcota bacterium]MBU1536967.1 hypothetical protein [Myxococcota bacterium]
MAQFTREEKFFKQLKFLISFNNPKVVALMAARGFDQESLDEGWRHLRGAAGWMFAIPESEKGILFADNSEMLTKLDAWENTWFDVADAGLNRKFPIMHKKIFTNLTKASGFGVDKKIRTFLDRIDDLEEMTVNEGEENPREALEMLEKRGLTKKERDYAKSLLKAVLDNPMPEEFMVDPKVIETKKRAEEDLWAWYLDWRKTARTIVGNEKLRAIMGIDDVVTEDTPTDFGEEDGEFLNFLE